MKLVPARRDAFGSAHAETSLIIAVFTILLTRGYLALTGYPQIGGGTLHIAHAVWGGALMMAALVIGWLFLSRRARVASVILGGIGFGLFLDEVGKFVTKDNDYFFAPAAAIMYSSVLLLVAITRTVRLARPLSATECLANATDLAAQGMAGGLTRERMQNAHDLLRRARYLGADESAIGGIEILLRRATVRPDRWRRVRERIAGTTPRFVRSPRWVPVFGWLQVLLALPVLVVGTIQIVANGVHPGHLDRSLFVGVMGMTDGILYVSAATTALIAIPVLLTFRAALLIRAQRLRLAALISTVLGAEAHFIQEQFAALLPLAFGLTAMAVHSHHVRRLRGVDPTLTGNPRPAPGE